MKMKSILMVSLLSSALLLAGCSNSGSTVKSSELSSVPSEEPSSSEVSSSEEPAEDRWELVEKDAFVAALNESKTKQAPYTSCVATGYVNGDQGYHFNHMEFLKNGSGKFVTADTSEAASMVSSLVNTRIKDFDYEHMGDGGSYIEPILYVSIFGKLKVTCIDQEVVTTVAFDEYGYFFYLAGGNAENPTRGAEIIVDWE